MSEVLSNFIQKFKDKKHYDFCLISAYPLAWLIVAYVGISELISLFSNNRLGLLEALLFTQIDLLSFKRSGIEILQNNSWRSVDSDTLLNDFRYWYNIIWIGVWGLSFRFLISKPVKTLVRNTDVNKVTQSYKLIYLNIRAIFKKTFSSFSNYLKTERENLKRIEGIKTSPNYYSRQDDNEKSIEYSWTGEREKTLEESDTPEFKECPYCCEQILYRAIKCKHCGSELEPTPEAKQVSANTTNVDSKTNNDEFTWKHFAGIGFVIALLYAIAITKPIPAKCFHVNRFCNSPALCNSFGWQFN